MTHGPRGTPDGLADLVVKIVMKMILLYKTLVKSKLSLHVFEYIALISASV